MCGIYKITNQINGKIYIGQSINIEKRWTAHKNTWSNPNSDNYNKPLYCAFRKYGINSFLFEVIEECSVLELNEKEIYWIHFFNSTDKQKGYNLTEGGTNSVTNNKLSLSEVKEIIELLKNTELSQEDIANKYNVSQRLVSGILLGQNWRFLTETYPINRKKNKEQNFCIDCGIKISSKATRCIDCLGKINRKTDRPSRIELKELIRSCSFTSIGRMYNVSDNAIRRWCNYYSLPRTKKDIQQYSEKDWENL